MTWGLHSWDLLLIKIRCLYSCVSDSDLWKNRDSTDVKFLFCVVGKILLKNWKTKSRRNDLLAMEDGVEGWGLCSWGQSASGFGSFVLTKLAGLKKTYMPHYQPIIPSCLVKLKRGLNPDLTGVIKLIFFFSLLKERSWMLNTGIFVFLKTALLLCVQIPSLCVCGVWVFFSFNF